MNMETICGLAKAGARRMRAYSAAMGRFWAHASLVAMLLVTNASFAGVVLSNGTASIGVNDQGNLIYQGVGLRYIPTKGEALAPGCWCEGWGVADVYTRKYAKAGEAFGDAYVTVESFTKDAESATSVVKAAGIMRVTHAFSPSESNNLYRVAVKIENISANPIHLLYRRVMDWDVPPTTFSEMVTIVTNGAKEVAYTSDNGFADGNPLSGPSKILFSGEATDKGPADHGALFDFDFGELPAGGTKEFVIYYGAAQNDNEALNALSQVGAEVYSFGKPNPSHPSVEPDGTPNTFIFGFGGVGGKPIIRVLPDLTLGGVRLVDNGAGQPFGISARVANAGHKKSGTVSGVTVKFYDGDPATGGTLLGQERVASLAPGEFKDVLLSGVATISAANVVAVVDPANEILECREQNNQDDAPFASSGAQATVAVNTDQTMYGPHAHAVLSAHVTNSGSFGAELTARLIVEDENGIGVYSSPVQPLGTVPSGGIVDLNDDWNTGTVIAGPYRLRGVVTDASGTQIAEAVSAFAVTHDTDGTAALSSTVVTDKPVYEPWGAVKITGRVINATENAIQGPAVAVVTVARVDGTVLYTGSSPIGELYPNSHADVEFAAWLADEAAGSLSVLLTVNGTGGGLLTTSAATFQVDRQPTSGLVGFVDVLHPELYRGDANVCTETVTNFGAGEISDVTIVHQVVAMDSGQVVGEKQTQRNLPGNSTQVDTWSVATNVPIGEYGCVLSVQAGGAHKTLAMGGYLVKEPPIRINSGWAVGEKGRVLVLLDDAANDGGQACGARELTFHANVAHGADAAVEVQLLDGDGAAVAVAHLPAAEGDAEALSVVLDESGINVHLQGLENRSLTLNAVVAQDGNTLRFTTGSVDYDCEVPRLYQVAGDFTVVAAADSANDPHGPGSAPALEAQQAFLETLLEEQGWEYTIVTDAEAFARELHHGGYSDYLLLSEQVKLPETLQDELIEAVNRGEGLVVAGDHDHRNNRLDEALGIAYRGKHAKASGVTLPGTEWLEAGEETFALGTHANRITLAGATVIGRYTGIAPEGEGVDPADADVAVTSFTYGRGRSVYAGFDLLAEATQAGDASRFADLLQRAALHVDPEEVAMTGNVAIPLVLRLENQGMAVNGQVVVTLPAGARIVSAGDGFIGDGTITWPYSLAVGEIIERQLMAIFPAGTQNVVARVETLTDGVYTEYATVTQTLTVSFAVAWDSAVASADALAATKSKEANYAKTARDLADARSAFEREAFAESVGKLTDAAQPLKTGIASDAISLRFNLDDLIREVGSKMP